MNSREIVLASRPLGLPSTGNFRTESKILDKPGNNEVLLKAWYFSVDPYMRGRMSNVKSYAPSFEVDKPIKGGVVARVIESRSKLFAEGDCVIGILPWATYCIEKAENLRKVDTQMFPPGYHLGILGMPGLTAYFGIMEIGKPKPGETVVISGAAGAVGIVAGQIAKLQGAYVAGIAGTDEKCKLLTDEYRFDVALNYKTSKALRKDIAASCLNGVDVYFDNVGGEVTDAVVANLNNHSRFVLCGQISQYNNTRIAMSPAMLPVFLTRSVMLQGFIVGNYSTRFDEARVQLTEWVSKGQLKYTETIIHGFDKLPETFISLFSGKNQGKMLVKTE
ncbi:MAG: NADP-dependent oxidoreductase [Bacteroidales bacterium]|nr:NADP-dependent oxidoreductase [Bacteroidales bacterium]